MRDDLSLSAPKAGSTERNHGFTVAFLGRWRVRGFTVARLAFACLLSVACEVEAACGDTTADGSINIGDALVIAQYEVGLRSTLPDFANCDVNQDSHCNIGDALRIAQCDVGLTSCAFPTSVITGKCPVISSTTTSTSSTSTSTRTTTSSTTTSTSTSTTTSTSSTSTTMRPTTT